MTTGTNSSALLTPLTSTNDVGFKYEAPTATNAIPVVPGTDRDELYAALSPDHNTGTNQISGGLNVDPAVANAFYRAINASNTGSLVGTNGAYASEQAPTNAAPAEIEPPALTVAEPVKYDLSTVEGRTDSVLARAALLGFNDKQVAEMKIALNRAYSDDTLWTSESDAVSGAVVNLSSVDQIDFVRAVYLYVKNGRAIEPAMASKLDVAAQRAINTSIAQVAQVNETQELMKKVLGELQGLRAEVAELKQANATLAAENTALRDENVTLKAELEKCKLELAKAATPAPEVPAPPAASSNPSDAVHVANPAGGVENMRAAESPGGWRLDGTNSVVTPATPAPAHDEYAPVKLDKIDTNRMQWVVAKIAEREGANPVVVTEMIKKYDKKLQVLWRGPETSARLAKDVFQGNGEVGPNELRAFEMAAPYSRQRDANLWRKNHIELPEIHAPLHQIAKEAQVVALLSRNEVAQAYAEKHGMTGEDLRQVELMLSRDGGKAGKIQADARAGATPGVPEASKMKPEVYTLWLFRETGVLDTAELIEINKQVTATRGFFGARNADINQWPDAAVHNRTEAQQEGKKVFGAEVMRDANRILRAGSPKDIQAARNRVPAGLRDDVDEALALLRKGELNQNYKSN